MSGAVIEPMRPTIEEKASSVWRYSVGYSSDVNRYSEVNTIEIPNLPSRNIIVARMFNSEKKKQQNKAYRYFEEERRKNPLANETFKFIFFTVKFLNIFVSRYISF